MRAVVKFVPTKKGERFFNAYRNNIMNTKQLRFKSGYCIYINKSSKRQTMEVLFKIACHM